MVKPDFLKWEQTVDDLRRLSTDSPHSRTRQRFLALFMIASGLANATSWAARIGVQDETVLRWIHRYNLAGPDALIYRRTGGSSPFLAPNQLPKPPKPPSTPFPTTMASLASAGPSKNFASGSMNTSAAG